jgi:hypothetical protein
MSFQMKQDTDIAARTEFNLGLDNKTVWVGNVRVEEIPGITVDFDAPKTPLDGDGNRVYNGTFDQGDQTRLNYWHIVTTGGATASASVSEAERKLNLSITDIGDGAKKDVDLIQKGMYLIQNQTYEVDFDANATSARDIEIELLSKSGLISYGKQTVSLDITSATKTASFAAISNATDPEAQLVFHLGGAAGTIKMDNIKLLQTSVYIDPSVKLFPLMNGSFEGTIQPWQEINVDGSASASLVNGEAKIAMSANEGSVPWGVMFIQDGLHMSKGMTYTLEFDARSTVARQIEFDLEDASYTRYFDQTVNLNTTMTHYKFEFNMSKDELVALKFLIGKMTGAGSIGIAHDIFFDNVDLEVKGAKQYANILTNGTIDNSAAGWDSYFDGTGSLAFDQGELKASLSGTGSANWSAQVYQNGLTLTKDKSYMLTFDARSSVARNIQAVVEQNGGSYTKYTDQIIALTNTMKTFSYTFTMPATDTAAHVNFLLGQIGGVAVGAHDVFLDNISLVEVNMPVLTPVEGHALLNGTFDTDISGWQTYLADGAGDGNTTVTSNTYHQLEVGFPVYDGYFIWSTQVYQTGLKLETGKTYQLKLDASTTVGRDIKLEILRNDGSTHLLDQQTVALNTNTQTFTYTFTVTGDTEQNAKLAFLMGGDGAMDGPGFISAGLVNSKIFLDNITLVELI